MFLRNNFKLIKDAIEESWRGKEGLVMMPDTVRYDDDEQKIKAKITYFGYPWVLVYYDADHNKLTHEESLAFFLDNLNTDIAIIDIAHQFPKLGLIGASWPDNELTVKSNSREFKVTNLNSFFSPETGVFDFNKFFDEKRKCQDALPKYVMRGLFTAQAATNESTPSENTIYPQTYESSLIVKTNSNPGVKR